MSAIRDASSKRRRFVTGLPEIPTKRFEALQGKQGRQEAHDIPSHNAGIVGILLTRGIGNDFMEDAGDKMAGKGKAYIGTNALQSRHLERYPPLHALALHDNDLLLKRMLERRLQNRRQVPGQGFRGGCW